MAGLPDRARAGKRPRRQRIGVTADDVAAITSTLIDSNASTGGPGEGGGSGGNGLGGGLYLDSGSIVGVAGSKITRNLALGGQGDGGGGDGQGIGGGVYDLGTFSADGSTVIRKNHASTSNNDIYPS